MAQDWQWLIVITGSESVNATGLNKHRPVGGAREV